MNSNKAAVSFISAKAALTRGKNKHLYRMVCELINSYEQALRFYANVANWGGKTIVDIKTGCVSQTIAAIDLDGGETARKALEDQQ